MPVLHPKFKTDYFKQHGRSTEWIDKVVDVAHKIWLRHYRPQTRTAMTPSASTATATVKKRLFDELDSFDTSVDWRKHDAFEEYITSPVIHSVSDPLQYWDAQLKAQADGGMARFALDYLSAPGKSKEVHISCIG